MNNAGKKAIEESSSQSTQSWHFLRYIPHAMSPLNPHSIYYGMKWSIEGIGGKMFN